MSRPSASEQPSQQMVQVVIAGLSIGIFILDCFFPLGFAIPTLFLIPIILTIRVQRPGAPFIMAGWATVLTIIGIWTSPIPSSSLQPGLFNRSLIIIACWLAATLIWHTTQKHARRELEQLVATRTTALRQSESTLHSFFDATDLMMGVVEVVDGRLIMVMTNRAAANIIGSTTESLANQPVTQVGFAPDAWDFWMPHLETARRTGKTVHLEYQFPAMPATTLSDRTIASAVSFIGLNEKGNPLYAWVEEDITEKKQMEQQMEASRRSLEASQTQLRQLAAQLLTAQEDERRRIARELHDDVSQRVVNLAYEIDNQMQATTLSPEASDALQLVKNEVADLSDHVRDLARRLHPSVLDDLGIASALQVYTQDFELREHIPVHLNLQRPNRPLERRLSECLFRVTQEALRNVAKHAKATEVHIALTYHEDHVQLQIDDDGCGFTPHQRQTAQQGLGLISMGERVRLVQGSISVTSEIGRGTHLSISLPFPGVRNEQTPHLTR